MIIDGIIIRFYSYSIVLGGAEKHYTFLAPQAYSYSIVAGGT